MIIITHCGTAEQDPTPVVKFFTVEKKACVLIYAEYASHRRTYKAGMNTTTLLWSYAKKAKTLSRTE